MLKLHCESRLVKGKFFHEKKLHDELHDEKLQVPALK